MNCTTAAMTPVINQHVRNQMSLMAWVMAFLCGWVLFLSARGRGAESGSTASAPCITVSVPTTQQ